MKSQKQYFWDCPLKIRVIFSFCPWALGYLYLDSEDLLIGENPPAVSLVKFEVKKTKIPLIGFSRTYTSQHLAPIPSVCYTL